MGRRVVGSVSVLLRTKGCVIHCLTVFLSVICVRSLFAMTIFEKEMIPRVNWSGRRSWKFSIATNTHIHLSRPVLDEAHLSITPLPQRARASFPSRDEWKYITNYLRSHPTLDETCDDYDGTRNFGLCNFERRRIFLGHEQDNDQSQRS